MHLNLQRVFLLVLVFFAISTGNSFAQDSKSDSIKSKKTAVEFKSNQKNRKSTINIKKEKRTSQKSKNATVDLSSKSSSNFIDKVIGKITGFFAKLKKPTPALREECEEIVVEPPFPQKGVRGDITVLDSELHWQEHCSNSSFLRTCEDFCYEPNPEFCNDDDPDTLCISKVAHFSCAGTPPGAANITLIDCNSTNHSTQGRCKRGLCFYLNPICDDDLCSNGIQDEDETGVDCGGDCEPCNTVACRDNHSLNSMEAGYITIENSIYWDVCFPENSEEQTNQRKRVTCETSKDCAQPPCYRDVEECPDEFVCFYGTCLPPEQNASCYDSDPQNGAIKGWIRLANGESQFDYCDWLTKTYHEAVCCDLVNREDLPSGAVLDCDNNEIVYHENGEPEESTIVQSACSFTITPPGNQHWEETEEESPDNVPIAKHITCHNNHTQKVEICYQLNECEEFCSVTYEQCPDNSYCSGRGKCLPDECIRTDRNDDEPGGGYIKILYRGDYTSYQDYCSRDKTEVIEEYCCQGFPNCAHPTISNSMNSPCPPDSRCKIGPTRLSECVPFDEETEPQCEALTEDINGDLLGGNGITWVDEFGDIHVGYDRCHALNPNVIYIVECNEDKTATLDLVDCVGPDPNKNYVCHQHLTNNIIGIGACVEDQSKCERTFIENYVENDVGGGRINILNAIGEPSVENDICHGSRYVLETRCDGNAKGDSVEFECPRFFNCSREMFSSAKCTRNCKRFDPDVEEPYSNISAPHPGYARDIHANVSWDRCETNANEMGMLYPVSCNRTTGLAEWTSNPIQCPDGKCLNDRACY